MSGVTFHFRTIQERTRRRVMITFHRGHELTSAFEFQAAAHLFTTPRSSVIPAIMKTSSSMEQNLIEKNCSKEAIRNSGTVNGEKN